MSAVSQTSFIYHKTHIYMPQYTYKVIPATSENLLLITNAKQALPSVASQWRTTCLVKKAEDNTKFGNVVCGTEFVWMLNLEDSELVTFDTIGFQGVETYTSPIDVMEVYSGIFDNSI